MKRSARRGSSTDKPVHISPIRIQHIKERWECDRDDGVRSNRTVARVGSRDGPGQGDRSEDGAPNGAQ